MISDESNTSNARRATNQPRDMSPSNAPNTSIPRGRRNTKDTQPGLLTTLSSIRIRWPTWFHQTLRHLEPQAICLRTKVYSAAYSYNHRSYTTPFCSYTRYISFNISLSSRASRTYSQCHRHSILPPSLAAYTLFLPSVDIVQCNPVVLAKGLGMGLADVLVMHSSQLALIGSWVGMRCFVLALLLLKNSCRGTTFPSGGGGRLRSRR